MTRPPYSTVNYVVMLTTELFWKLDPAGVGSDRATRPAEYDALSLSVARRILNGQSVDRVAGWVVREVAWSRGIELERRDVLRALVPLDPYVGRVKWTAST